MLSKNVEDYSSFCKSIFETLEITKVEQQNQLFVLSLIKKIKQFSILRGHPQLSNKILNGKIYEGNKLYWLIYRKI